MFQALVAHRQEILHKCSFGDLCAVVDVGWSQDLGRLPNTETNPHIKLHVRVTKADTTRLQLGDYCVHLLVSGFGKTPKS
jgi:hypothetical protein